MTKKEIKSTDNGFMVIDEDNNVVHEYDWAETAKKLIKSSEQLKALIADKDIED